MSSKSLTSIRLASFALFLVACGGEASTVEPERQAPVGGSSATLDALVEQMNLPKKVRGGGIRHAWSEDGQVLYFSEQNPEKPTIWRLDLKTGDRRDVFDSVETAMGEQLSLYDSIDQSSEPIVYLDDGARVYSLDLETSNIEPASSSDAALAKARTPQLYGRQFPQTPGRGFFETASPNGERFAFVQNNEVFIRTVGGQSITLSTSTADTSAWNNFSFRWTPDSQKLAVILDDHKQSPKLPIIDWLSDEYPASEKAFYPPVGGVFAQGALHIFDVEGRRLEKTIATGEADHYLRLDRFSTENNALYYFTVSRDGLRLAYWRVNIDDGSRTKIFEEAGEGPLVYPYAFSVAPDAAPIHHLSDDRGFLWLSERSGERNLYHYPTGGLPPLQLTQGLGRVHSIVGYDKEADKAYLLIQSDTERPYDTHLFSVALQSGETQALTTGDGRRSVQLSPKYDFFIETVSTPVSPARVLLRSTQGVGEPVVLSEARFDDPSLWTAPEEIRLNSADGDAKLYGLLYKPPAFDASKQYPLLEYIYAGPQAVWTPKTFLTRGHYPRALAKAGYLVLVMDGRGTPERDPDFQNFVYGRMGQVEIADHAAAIKELLATRPYIHEDRIGVFGTSFGGYYAVRAMLDAPDIYAAGVSSAPAVMERAHMFTPVEAFMGLRENNEEGYAAFSFASKAETLSGPLLILTGTSDANTPFGHALEYMDIFIEARKPVRMVVMPGRNHHFMTRDDTVRNPYWIASVRDFFDDVFMDGVLEFEGE